MFFHEYDAVFLRFKQAKRSAFGDRSGKIVVLTADRAGL